MTIVRLPTPFDDPRRQPELATPTCGCACCCCCWLVSTLTSTTMVAVHVNDKARARDETPLAQAGLLAAAIVGSP